MYALKTLQPEFEIKLPSCMYTSKCVTRTDASSASDERPGQQKQHETRGCEAVNGIDNANTATASENTNNNTSNITTCTVTTTASASSSSSLTSSSRISPSKAELAKYACRLDLDILGAQIQQIIKNSTDTNAVALRQEKVLHQLHELMEQLATIRSSLGLCQKGPQHTGQKQPIAVNNGGLREEPTRDIVINGHPNFIPYALLALKNAWRQLFTIDIKTFTHSTLPDIGAEAREFERQLAAVPVGPAKSKINVTLIWKNCEHTEMICSPTMYVPIYGEVNIIRYLGRVGPSEYRYENSPLCNEIDAVLDICYQLLRCTTTKGRAPLLRALHQRLGQQQYFGGECISVADIGVHSSLKRMPSISDKDLTPALIEWRNRAQAVTLL